LGLTMLGLIACGSTETIIQTVEVPVERVVTEQVIQTVEVEKVVTEQVVQTVEVDRNVNQEVLVEVTAVPETAVPTFFGLPIPESNPSGEGLPSPKSKSGTAVIRTGLELRGSGIPGDESPFLPQSVSEKFFLTDKGGNAVPQVVDSWDLATDLSSITFKLQEGVPFHGGYGNLSSADVVWSYNMGNPGYTPESTTDGGASWISFLGNEPVTAIDDLTVRFPIAQFDVRWDTFLFGQSGLALGITSKAAYDQNGEDWARENVIGTGPFQVERYVRDDILEVSAVKPHHRATPSIDTLITQSIPDTSVAEAAFKTGAIDILSGPLNLRNVGGFTADGYAVLSAGAGSFHTISFSGNYWERTHYTTGEDLGPNFAVNNSIPWIGDPQRDSFGNPPEGMTNMERAALVRKALSLAIDRVAIAEVLTGGAGWPGYIYGADFHNPNWDDKWNLEFDPSAAEAMLDQAGYPRNDKGIRFEMPFFIRLGRGDEEIGTAVVGMWSEIGVDMQDWKAQYQTYRPNLVGRTAIAPWIHSAGAESPQAPWDWPVMGTAECSSGRGGFNIGIEIRELCEFFTAMSAEPDKAKRIELRNDINDFLFEWNPVIATIAVPQIALANPNKIASWDMPLSVREAQTHHPEFLVLK